jgi:ubiquinone/menaquinone biosynthesis C-methylase UbiE
MQRTPEPELMDEAEQAQAYADADFAAPHEHCVRLYKARFGDEPRAGFVLDLGCGPGDISRRFARHYPRARVHGVDGADAMLNLGHDLNKAEGLDERVTLVKAYLPADRAPRATYDAVISNSLLHHLHDPSVIWRTVNTYARAGAPVFIMDLRRPPSREVAEWMRDEYAGDEPDVLKHDFFHSLLAAFTPREIQTQLEEAGLGYLTVETVSDRHVIVWGRKR